MTKNSSETIDDAESTSAHQAAASPTSASDTKRVVASRIPIFLITFLLAAIVLLPAAWFLTPVTYTAEAEIRFLSVRPRILDSSEGIGVGPGSYEKYVNTEAATITGTTILERVLNDPDVRGVPEVVTAPDKLAFLSARVRARPNSGTELVTVECTMRDRDAAKLILEVVVNEYMNYARTVEGTVSIARSRILDAERETQEKNLAILLDDMSELKNALGVGLDGTSDSRLEKVSIYREGLIRADEDLSSLRVQLANLEAKIARADETGGDAPLAGTNAAAEARIERDVDADPRVTSLLGELALAQLAYAKASARYSDGHSQMGQFEEEIAVIEAQIELTRRTVRAEIARSNMLAMAEQAESIGQGIQDAEVRVAKYERLVDENEQRLQEEASDFAKLRELEDKVAERRGLIDALSRQITDLRLESKAPAPIQPASAPTVPLRPAGVAAKIAAALFAFVTSAGLGFVLSVAVRKRGRQS